MNNRDESEVLSAIQNIVEDNNNKMLIIMKMNKRIFMMKN